MWRISDNLFPEFSVISKIVQIITTMRCMLPIELPS